MRKNGLTLIEILVSAIILALVLTGLANIFVAGKRHILHTRSRMTAAELGRFFLDPLQMDVRQDQWRNNCLSAGLGCPGPYQIDNIIYSPNYTVTLDSPIPNINRATITWTWSEP